MFQTLEKLSLSNIYAQTIGPLCSHYAKFPSGDP